MSKKRFNKKEGFRFTLLHRSQRDPLYHDEENGSKFILHPADQKTAEAMSSGLAQYEGAVSYLSSESAARKKEELNKKKKQQVGPIQEFREVDDYGFPLDGYDYSKHLSTVGGGAFISADGRVIERAIPEPVKETVEEDVLQLLPGTLFASQTEQPRLLEAITLRPDNMDEDMKRQLGLASDEDEEDAAEEESDATGAWGDLQDDFMLQIIQSGVDPKQGNEEDEVEEEETTEGQEEVKGKIGADTEFDFDAHMARLMQEAENEDEEMGDEEEEEDEFDRLASKRADTGGRPVRNVDEHFEAVLEAEYGDGYEDDDDQYEEEMDEEAAIERAFQEQEEHEEDEEEDVMGELHKYDDANHSEPSRKRSDLESRSTLTRRSKRALEATMTQDDPVFLQAMNEFLQEKANDHTLGQVAQPLPASETMRMVKTQQFGQDQDDGEFDEEKPPTMEEFLKAWGTYTMTQKPMHDCETIVSTLSTTDNIPSEIVIENKKRKARQVKKETTVIEEEEEDDDEATVESVTREIARLAMQGLTERSRNETPDERKARKAQVKAVKRDRRAEKKQTKDAFKRERVLAIHAMTAAGAPKPGVSEFKM